MHRIFLRNMSQKVALKLGANADLAEKRLVDLKIKLGEIKKNKIVVRIGELKHENESLIHRIETAKAELIRLEVLHGKQQYPIPGNVDVLKNKNVMNDSKSEPEVKKEKKEKLSNKNLKEKSAPVADDSIIADVRKLDFRIGKIVDINKHPDADSLYVEKIDCGEECPRTVVSGLVNHVPIDEMRDRIVMVLCNLKPVKMRGVTSEAMVMCASSSDKVEVLLPPNGSVPGDLVTCEGYPREPDQQLNPKKKIFETCAPDLKTNSDRVACYKDSPLVVPNKGPVTSPTLKGVSVK